MSSPTVPAVPGHACRLARAGQAPDHDDGRVHRARRLRHRFDGLAVDARPGRRARRDRPRRRGRQRSQPGDGAGHGRADAAHADAPHPVRAHPARRGPGLRRPRSPRPGSPLLLWLCGPLAAAVAFATWASYLFAYTPLKRRTPLATLVGAVPGALPPVIGWAAARGRLDAGRVHPLRDPLPLADPALPRHRLALPRRLRPGRVPDAARARPRGDVHRPAGGRAQPGAAAR